MRWYVVMCKDREVAVDNLGAQGFDTYMPLMKVSNEKGIIRTIPMFGRYMFVQFDIDKQDWRKIWNTRGVSGLICMDPEWPSPVPEEVIAEMKRQEETAGCVTAIDRVFKVGDRVEIKVGAFAGHSGLLDFSSSKRVSILLHLLGGQTKVYIDPAHIEHTSCSAVAPLEK